tara:strand:- start:225 stop:440 length:216 start_codon:yes stop_codon:yes gene_type:complete
MVGNMAKNKADRTEEEARYQAVVIGCKIALFNPKRTVAVKPKELYKATACEKPFLKVNILCCWHVRPGCKI